MSQLNEQMEFCLCSCYKCTQKDKEQMFYMYNVINDKGQVIYQDNDKVNAWDFCDKYNKESKRFCELRESRIDATWKAVIQKPEWIPALVKYQEIPSWWRMTEVKAKLMGEVILVKAVSDEEKNSFIQEYGKSKADYWSVRKSKADYWSVRKSDGQGKWYWNKVDLILYPDAVEVEMYASAKWAHNKGVKTCHCREFKRPNK